MEATVVSVGKSVLDGALSYAKSAVAEEVALQLGVQRDQVFIREELEMMRSFLMAAHEERDENKVLKTWVKQVRDVAYDVEDCLQDFAVHLEKPSRWRIPRTLRERRRIAKQMKELRARVEDVSQRNMLYQLNKDPTTKPANAAAQSISRTSATMFAKQDKPKVDLVQLINKEDEDLRVIAVWGTGGHVGLTSIIREAYENPNIKGKFPCRAWVRVMHPFNPKIFVQSLVKQFNAPVGVDAMLETEKTERDLAQELNRYVNEESFLIVLNDLSTIEEWDQIKACFVSNKKGSRIIVSTAQVEVASLCAGQESRVSELKELSDDQTLYVFYEKMMDVEDSEGMSMEVEQDRCDQLATAGPAQGEALHQGSSTEAGSNSSNATASSSNSSAERNSLTGMETTEAAAFKELELVGRVHQKAKVIELILKDSKRLEVISVWGMGGLGKTTLVRNVYRSEELSGKFDKRACVTVGRPFDPKDLLRSLAMQLNAESSKIEEAMDFVGRKTKLEDDQSLPDLLKGKKYLIVLDNLSSITEWDAIKEYFPETETASRIIVTTREWDIAKHCSVEQKNIYKLSHIGGKDAKALFTKKVFKEEVDLDEKYPELANEAKLILKKCDGLPLAIVAIGGFLANQPKTTMEWRKFNEHISAELEMNPKLETIRTVLDKSYDGLPYHLKSCFLYLSIFPEGHKVRRERLVQRWTAEGYSRDTRQKSAEKIADKYFMDLINRSMILPCRQSLYIRKGIDSCQVHDIMREICISKSMEENLVFRLEEGCGLDSQGTIRHLAISSWEGDQNEFESILDVTQIRSLTVFGKWRPFFISDKMRLLRVLDLEDTSHLVNHHLEHIGKLLHLRYLSLRGCNGIWHLPDSLGNLRQLRTLNIENTNIYKLPKTIIKLRKLRHIFAGSVLRHDNDLYEEAKLPKLVKNDLCLSTLALLGFCLSCCAPQLLKRKLDMDGDPNRCDVCTVFCCTRFPSTVPHILANGVANGVLLPRGVRKLQALHTMGLVDVARGKAVLQDIKMLAQLRRLEVTGVNKNNCQELCSALAALSHLEALLVRSQGEPGLYECLDGVSSPLKNLQRLILYGNLVKLPEWIKELQNLVTLSLRSTRILELSATIEVLGKLPNLNSLRLRKRSFQGKELRFNFCREAFPSLVVLVMSPLENLKSVEFEKGATPKLELLFFWGLPSETNTGLFSGLQLLPSLKEFKLWKCKGEDKYKDDFVEDLRAQLAVNTNRPVLLY